MFNYQLNATFSRFISRVFEVPGDIHCLLVIQHSYSALFTNKYALRKLL